MTKFSDKNWTELYSVILDECNWITVEMINDESTNKELQILLETRIIPIFINPENHTIKSFLNFITVNKVMIAYRFKIAYFGPTIWNGIH